MSPSGFQYTSPSMFRTALNTTAFREPSYTYSKSEVIRGHGFSSTFVAPESLLQCHQNLDDTFSFTHRLERLPHYCSQHPSAVPSLHRIPGR